MEFLARAGKNEQGEVKLEMSEYTAKLYRQFLKDNQGIRIKISSMTPESSKMRRFLMGAVIPLWTYLDGSDYRNSEVLANRFEAAKIEFNGMLVSYKGKTIKIGQSTKGEKLREFTEKMIDFLVEQYGIDPMKVLNVAAYKHWKDTVFPYSDIDNFIDYMRKTGDLK